MDSRLILLLNKIKEQPGLFIGTKSLIPLWHFLHGYQYCLFDIEGDYYNMPGFQEYIEDIYNFHGVHSWAQIIQSNCIDDEAAFDKFYVHLDDYLSKMSIGSESKS
ncbi:hypothetical protein GQF01_02040 [Paenibacillus sp. 5J-6]|uniref:Uncharacterized protein n=1 Tax=Paenibacillus silvestris TaxID=2606219 RepID=A0A6L8UUX3_9BACL|nr:hypothetical protein [Paenibacillus silvestris]MZQ80920.1 hypothetical protein [Paenibacillus silvestris]